MKKHLFLFLTLVLGLAISCKEEPVDKPVPPTPGEAPTIELRAQDTTSHSFSFTIVSPTANKFGYQVREASTEPAPSAEELLAGDYGAMQNEITLTVENLTPDTQYQIFAVVAIDNLTSEVASLELTTKKANQDPDFNFIQLIDAQYTSFKFRINGGESHFKFIPVEAAMLQEWGVTPEEWMETVDCVVDQGDKEYEWVDGLTYENINMSVAPGREYVIIAGLSDAQGNLSDGVDTIKFRTPSIPDSDAEISVNFEDVTSTSVRAYINVDETISMYYVYVRDKAWFDEIIGNYGLDMIKTLIKYPSAGAPTYSGSRSVDWSGLIPNTQYVFSVLGVDNQGSEILIMEDFSTTEPTGPAPELTLSLSPNSAAPHSILDLSFGCTNALMARWAVLMTCEVEDLYNSGMTNESIVNDYGTTLSDEQLAQATNGNLVIKLDNLFRSTEYTVICAVRSVEYVQTTEAISASTENYPSVPRVESSLFDLLPGTWNVEYQYTTPWGESHSLSGFQVTIADGADDASAQEYRSLNRLVVLGLQFQSNSTYPYMGPQELINDYGFDEDMAYRDYGPKFFLEIGEGDVVTCPTDASNNFAYFTQDRLYFLGCDLNNRYIAPVDFPVEISSDKNTITIKECVLTSDVYPAEGGVIPAGTYRPAILKNSLTDAINIMTSNLVLTRAE